MLKPHLVPPESVRVWRGFRSTNLNLTDFLNKLSTVFIPATVLMQNKIGLAAYIPSIPCGLLNKPDTVPDETAILFWNTQNTYTESFETLAVRTYTLTHAAVYRPESGAAFPNLFTGTLIKDQPYYLINKPADWMVGTVSHFIGSRPSGVQPVDFLLNISSNMVSIQDEGEIDGGVVCAGNDYVVYWELGNNSSGGLAKLKTVVDWQITINPNNIAFKKGLWEKWPGMGLNPGDSFNTQFRRYS